MFHCFTSKKLDLSEKKQNKKKLYNKKVIEYDITAEPLLKLQSKSWQTVVTQCVDPHQV